jgi:hypothetical protein
MKALIGMLLITALATDFGGEANAQCAAGKRVTHRSHSGQLAVKTKSTKNCICKKKSKRTNGFSVAKSRSYTGNRVDTTAINPDNVTNNIESLNPGVKTDINTMNNNVDTINAIDYDGFYHSPGLFNDQIGK